MRYTEYLKQCISELELGAEYESDAKLVYLVRIQHLTERITHLHCPDAAAEETFSFPRPPRAVYVPAMQSEWDRINNALPESLRSDSECPTWP